MGRCSAHGAWCRNQPCRIGLIRTPIEGDQFESRVPPWSPWVRPAPCGKSAHTRVPIPAVGVGRRGLPEVRPQAFRVDDPPGDPPGVSGTPARLAPPTPGRDFSRTDFPGRCQPGLPVPGPRGGAGCSAEGGSGRRSLSDFVGQPWPRRRPHRRAGEHRDARRAGRSWRWGPCERAQARPGARRAAACPRAAAPGRAPGDPPTTTGCSGDPGCSDRGAAPAAGLGPPGVGATPTPDPRSRAPWGAWDSRSSCCRFTPTLSPAPRGCPLLCLLVPQSPGFSPSTTLEVGESGMGETEAWRSPLAKGRQSGDHSSASRL